LSRYLKASPRSAPRNHFALVVAEGDIVRGDPNDDGGEGLTSYGFDALLRQAAADPLVRGILVRIDSPGGEVSASDEMWREMSLTNRKKPVVISMSDVAASGGYYMALTGDPIVAYPQTETGSIGVVFGKPNLHGLYDNGLSDRQSTDASDRAVDSRVVLVRANDRLQHFWRGTCRVGIRFTIEQRTSRIVTAMAGASSPSPNDSTPPTHSSSWKGTDRSERTTTFGRNRRTSGLCPASRPISRTVSEAITEMLASSKMPCFNCIICTGAP
jgi:hypothetical protein